MLRKHENGNLDDMSWWSWCTSLSELSPREAEGALLCKGSLGEGICDGMTWSGSKSKDNESDHLETLE